MYMCIWYTCGTRETDTAAHIGSHTGHGVKDDTPGQTESHSILSNKIHSWILRIIICMCADSMQKVYWPVLPSPWINSAVEGRTKDFL